MKFPFLYKSCDRGFDFEIQPDPVQKEQKDTVSKVSKDLSKNSEYVRKRFSLPKNGDIVVRNISFFAGESLMKALLVCVDGLSSGEAINEVILKPLMRLKKQENTGTAENLDYIINHLIPYGQITRCDDINKMIETVNIGNAIMFFDGIDEGIILDTKSWEHRSVGSPVAEQVIQGPHEGFNEVLRSNTALIRKTLNTPELIMQTVFVGKTSKTPGSVAYLGNVANDSLVREVIRRIESIDAEYVLSSLDVEQYIEEASFLPIPQIITTERPDRVCRALTEGRVALILNGSSHALIMPASVFDLASSVEDEYLRYPYSLLIRFVRMAAVVIALLAPGFFVAATMYHQELILTELFLSIRSSRLPVPFSVIVELLIMELSFELIREAGVRVPGHIGSTVGIVGGLILGTAAVDANIVSPVMIIVVAITGIASFVIPSYSLSFSFRFTRFIYIFGAAVGGFPGLLCLFFSITLMYMGTKSFGVPYGSPLAPLTETKGNPAFFRLPLWKQDQRPDYLKPKDSSDKAHISRKWLYKGDKHD